MVADAVSSRTQTDRQLALEQMGRIGAFVNTTESVALSLVGDAAHPKFKVVTFKQAKYCIPQQVMIGEKCHYSHKFLGY